MNLRIGLNSNILLAVLNCKIVVAVANIIVTFDPDIPCTTSQNIVPGNSFEKLDMVGTELSPEFVRLNGEVFLV